MPEGRRSGSLPPIRSAVATATASALALLSLFAVSGLAEARAAGARSAAHHGRGHGLAFVSERRKTRHSRSARPPRGTRAPATAPTEVAAPGPAPALTAKPATAPAPKPAPKPSPTPSPSLTPSSGPLFSGTHLRDFWLNQSAPGAIAEVPDPAGSGETAFKFTVGDNDMTNITSNPRAELLSPHTIKAGEELWWSAKVFLPADFPASTPNFVNLLQGPYGEPWVGSPPFHVEVEGAYLKWQRNATYNWDVPWQMPLVRNRWVSFLIHERFGSDGWIEMWVNGAPITFFAGPGAYNPNHVTPTEHLGMQTMDSSNNAKPNSIYLQSYRKKGMYPSLTVYQGPLRIGKTRASVGG